jgi:electron transfer flavoprotein alpha subunit
MLVLAEIAGARPDGRTLERLTLARALAGDAATVAVVAFGAQAAAAAATLGAYGADQLHAVDAAAEFDSEVWCATIVALARNLRPEAILLGHTSSGADLAPRLAMRLGGAALTGCTAVERRAGALVFTRPCHGGNARESLVVKAGPAVATLRGGMCEAVPAAAPRAARVADVSAAPAGRTRVVAAHRNSTEGVRLEDASVVVAGGRGVGAGAGFAALHALAAALGGAVGASRVACDLGWCSAALQIGLTGKTVAPELYIAAGISGASHHMAGCGAARNIVAINNDPEAPIFSHARFGVVGDCAEVIPALTAAIEAARKESDG